MDSETVGFILLTDVQGTKFDTTAKSALKKYITGSTQHSPANVLRGELLLGTKQESPHFNYMLNRDHDICLFSDENDVAPLNSEEFLLLEAIGAPYDRLDTFNSKLEWGVHLKTGGSVYVTIPGANLSVVERARATIHYKGPIGKVPGINFGVEILERHRAAAIGTTDGTFQGKRYFTCEDKCGFFAPLHLMSPASDVPSHLEGTPVDSADLSKGERNKRDYSGATKRDNSGASSQTPPQNPSYSRAVSEGRKGPPQHVQQRPDLVKESSVDRPSKFQLGQRVAFYDNKQGAKHYGIVRWTGRESRTKKLPYLIVGIQTDKDVYITDFEKSVVGMSYLTPSVPNRRALFLPETLIDEVKRGSPQPQAVQLEDVHPQAVPPQRESVKSLAKQLNMSPEEVREQKKAMEEAERSKIVKEDKVVIDVLVAAEESVNITGQQEAYRRLEAENEAKKRNNVDITHGLKGSAGFAQEREEGMEYCSSGGGQGDTQRRPSHPYEDVRNDNDPSSKDADVHRPMDQVTPQHELTAHGGRYGYEHRLDAAQEYNRRHEQTDPSHADRECGFDHDGQREQPRKYGGAGATQFNQSGPLAAGRDPRQDSQYVGHKLCHDSQYANCDPRHDSQYLGRESDSEYANRDPRHDSQYAGREPHDSQYAGHEPRHDSQYASRRQDQLGRPQQHDPASQYHVDQLKRAYEYQPNQGEVAPINRGGWREPQYPGHADPVASHKQGGAAIGQGQEVLAKAGNAGTSNLTEGSLIQIPAPDPNNPMRYGTIKWIGIPPGVDGRIAGIELDEIMEGCSDGTYPNTDRKFFSCSYGKGLYYPLENLQPDERYAPEVSIDGNPLRHVSEEEITAPVVLTPLQYIGEGKGIQGHQNSCYLDATLFGLFALTSEFDDMFLQNADSRTTAVIGNILWKNIVNPLRKNGVVKYECVMRLREQLDQLGKMKGITQDEKDPEEFLNMMFKHTLLVQPFISIRRPFGVEKEYFVQLFLEMDEAQKSPSIGDLVEKMFSEQNISFTEVPSKLLIQVPRFGKKFQTFRKIIPAENINVARNVDLSNPLECYNCQGAACKKCRECAAEYGGHAPAFCDTCLEMVHKKSRRHHKWEWCDEMKHIMGLAEFELLSVICIETSHYVCFARQEKHWIFFDSMANRVYDKYNIPKVVDCTDVLNEWVYPKDGNLTRLLNTPPRELPEYVRRFTQDIYMCVYIQPDVSMYS